MACGGRCLAWHGWLPTLSPRRVHLPWAVAMADGAALECALGAYPVHPGSLWDSGKHPEDVNDLAGDVPANPDIWADGSRDEDLDALVDCRATPRILTWMMMSLVSFLWSVAFFKQFKGRSIGGYPCPSSADACSSRYPQRKCLQ